MGNLPGRKKGRKTPLFNHSDLESTGLDRMPYAILRISRSNRERYVGSLIYYILFLDGSGRRVFAPVMIVHNS